MIKDPRAQCNETILNIVLPLCLDAVLPARLWSRFPPGFGLQCLGLFPLWRTDTIERMWDISILLINLFYSVFRNINQMSYSVHTSEWVLPTFSDRRVSLHFTWSFVGYWAVFGSWTLDESELVYVLPFVRVQIRAVFRWAALPPVLTLVVTQHVPENTIPCFTNRSHGFSWAVEVHLHLRLPVWEVTVGIISVHEQRCYGSGCLLTGPRVWNVNHSHITCRKYCIFHNLLCLFGQMMLCSLKGNYLFDQCQFM